MENIWFQQSILPSQSTKSAGFEYHIAYRGGIDWMKNFIKQLKHLDEKLILIVGGLALLIIFLLCPTLVYVLIIGGLIWLTISWFNDGFH
jgi:hypothetical protein